MKTTYQKPRVSVRSILSSPLMLPASAHGGDNTPPSVNPAKQGDSSADTGSWDDGAPAAPSLWE